MIDDMSRHFMALSLDASHRAQLPVLAPTPCSARCEAQMLLADEDLHVTIGQHCPESVHYSVFDPSDFPCAPVVAVHEHIAGTVAPRQGSFSSSQERPRRLRSGSRTWSGSSARPMHHARCAGTDVPVLPRQIYAMTGRRLACDPGDPRRLGWRC